MSLLAFLRKHVRARSRPSTVFKSGIFELNRRLNDRQRQRPYHIASQRRLIDKLLTGDTPAWLVFLDAGRYDLFDELVWDYFDGDLSRAWNGGVGYTGDWCAHNLTGEYPNMGFFSWVPIHGFVEADWDEREHFDVCPNIRAGRDVGDQLAALGYREPTADGGLPSDTPDRVNRTVGDHMADIDGGVVRYIKPHPPFDGLEGLTSGPEKTLRVRQALRDGDLTLDELTLAYISTYRSGFEAAAKLVPQLPGRVVLTTDHGTCLSCGQLFHGRNLDKHDHLTVVPWFEVDK